ncbi:hypothetical protein BW716_03735 [[Flexibacter] sp. ATCC 35208]|nr:hypothetical protein BW716_03735 [[Flexibacter] sp. ATCC 35208]
MFPYSIHFISSIASITQKSEQPAKRIRRRFYLNDEGLSLTGLHHLNNLKKNRPNRPVQVIDVGKKIKG